MSLDLAVIGQDPRFGGGYRSQVEAFWDGAVALGREPHLLYASLEHGVSPLRRPGLRPREERSGQLTGTAYPAFLPELAPVSLRLAGRRMARALPGYGSRWVVATSAPYGCGVRAAGAPYACWIGTDLASEWKSRRTALSVPRRAALALGARGLHRLERDVLRGADRVYATTPSSRDRIVAAGDVEVGILPIPVDVGRFSPEPDDQWLARLDTPVLAFVGRAADPRKNVGLLLEALPVLRRRVPAARVLLVGGPPAQALPDGVEATGLVADVAPLLRRASLLVLPSLQEGFGIVVAEALAAGVPALVTPSGGPEELVGRSGGGVVLSGFEAEELAETAGALLENRERLTRMRHAGRAYVEEHHGPQQFRELLAEAFRELDG